MTPESHLAHANRISDQKANDGQIIAALVDALGQIARMQKDGEDGFELTNDDAVDSLHSCIELARDALTKIYVQTRNGSE